MNPNRRTLSLPASYESRMNAELERIGYSLSEPRKLAEAVLRLSDHYTQNPDAASPWAEPWAQAASLAYYFPLNYSRNLAAAQEAARLGFFEGLETLIDFGSGMGSALCALADTSGASALAERHAYDVSREALHLGLSLIERTGEDSKPHRTHAITGQERKPQDLMRGHKTLLAASYVLTELAEPPAWWMEAEALMILEPSTQDDARRLMRYREELIAKGFKIWAPCTHEGPCPLLHQSGKDWCHDRIHFAQPKWFEEMEKHLPMKNKTLTFSYLLARKSKAPAQGLKSLARLTGDMLEEKGKTRQSICRASEREFIAWFPQRLKKGEEIRLERGSLVRLQAETEKKSSEIRLKSPSDIQEIAPGAEIPQA